MHVVLLLRRELEAQVLSHGLEELDVVVVGHLAVAEEAYGALELAQHRLLRLGLVELLLYASSGLTPGLLIFTLAGRCEPHMVHSTAATSFSKVHTGQLHVPSVGSSLPPFFFSASAFLASSSASASKTDSGMGVASTPPEKRTSAVSCWQSEFM